MKKIVKSLEESDILLKSVSETKMKQKYKEVDFLVYNQCIRFKFTLKNISW